MRTERVSGPVRTCIGCRARDEAGNLVRIVAREGSCVVDHGRGGPGRGAYVHRREECLDQLERRSGLARALRVPGPLGTNGLRAAVLETPTAEGNRPR